jgi:uncharacterized protein (DUF1810 family)
METDSHNLQRFIDAQENTYQQALSELRRGKKQTHWIWYIFPQVAGLGSSSMAERYAIKSSAEAVAYAEHDILGARLRECTQALLAHGGRDIDDIMGFPDNLKLKSSMTLFAAISPPGSIFETVLDQFFGGQSDEKTVSFLKSN